MSGSVNMNVDSTAAAASAEPTPTPSMVAERPVTTVPEGARADVQAMLDQAMATFRIELRSEIGKEFDTAMNTNFASLNKAMSDTHLQMKGYVDTSSVELIAKFDKIFADKTTAIEAQIKALEENIKTAVNKMGQTMGDQKSSSSETMGARSVGIHSIRPTASQSRPISGMNRTKVSSRISAGWH